MSRLKSAGYSNQQRCRRADQERNGRQNDAEVCPRWCRCLDKIALVEAVKTAPAGLRTEVIFDVGANIGETAIALAADLPEATVYAFEPVAETFRTLVQNARA